MIGQDFRDTQHFALHVAGKGIPVDEWGKVVGSTDLIHTLVSKGYVYVSDEARPRVMLEVAGARCLLDYEGLWINGRPVNLKA